MISQLSISNYALIDSLTIDFTRGLNIITGETGAGKSIILGALALLLGTRADSKAIRQSQSKSVVEAIFNVEGVQGAKVWAADNDIDWDQTECILRREISPTGRSRAFINDTPVNIGQLEELGRQLIDIHSQSQNLKLADADFQLDIIDAIAGNSELLAQFKEHYADWRKAEKEFSDAERSIEQNRADQEFISFKLKQLNEASLVAGEQEELESERELQANMTDIKQLLTDALDSISASSLQRAVEAVEELGEILEGTTELAQRLETARVEIQDIAETLEDYDANLGADPAALAQAEERLSEIYSLERRHNVDTVEELIEIREKLRSRLDAIDNGDMLLNDLRKGAQKAKEAAGKTARKLTERRKDAAITFAAQLEKTARPLGLNNLHCEVDIQTLKELSSSGLDALEFRFAFNKNQKPMAIAGAASGGEVSRLMLCIKSILAGRLQLPTIIFDEIDTGVSGDVANRIGEMMLNISHDIQVITITHLPQVAARGTSHFKVFKEDDDKTTHTRLRRLSDDERREEIALMLSGSTTDSAALANADSLLNK